MAVPLLTKKIIKKRVQKFKRPQCDRKISVKVIYSDYNNISYIHLYIKNSPILLFCYLYLITMFLFMLFTTSNIICNCLDYIRNIKEYCCLKYFRNDIASCPRVYAEQVPWIIVFMLINNGLSDYMGSLFTLKSLCSRCFFSL